MAIPTRQQEAFPTVARIFKGTPKKKLEKNNKTFEVFGDDLKNKFRVHFLAGTQNSRENFHSIHAKEFKEYPANYVIRNGYEVEVLRALIPSRTVWTSWHWENVTYDAARRKIAVADGEKYLFKRDPLTNEVLISNGEPYEKFNVGDVITYEREGKKYVLPMKSRGILKLFLPELMEGVSFELVTNSYIDSLKIQQHLGAIQNVADAINGGMATGIPLDIYRIEEEVPYFDSKQSQARSSKKWFIQIKPNRAWMQAAIRRMQNFALTGEAVMNMLQPGETINLQAMPEQAFKESDEENDLETIEPEMVEIVDDDVKEIVIESSVPAPKLKQDARMWSVSQKNVLIESGKADNDFAAKGMLGLSNLPADATEAEILAWGTTYRNKRDSINPETGKKFLAPEAAQFANEAVLV